MVDSEESVEESSGSESVVVWDSEEEEEGREVVEAEDVEGPERMAKVVWGFLCFRRRF